MTIIFFQAFLYKSKYTSLDKFSINKLNNNNNVNFSVSWKKIVCSINSISSLFLQYTYTIFFWKCEKTECIYSYIQSITLYVSLLKWWKKRQFIYINDGLFFQQNKDSNVIVYITVYRRRRRSF